MKKKLLLTLFSLCLCMLVLCACSIEGEPPAKEGNAPVTGERRDESETQKIFDKEITTENSVKDTTQKNQDETKPQKPHKTFTGLAPLQKRVFTVSDPENKRQLPTKSIEHSFGISKNAVPNHISLDAQKFFDEKHFNAVCIDTKTKSFKPLYLTFDCGWENGYTGKVLDILKEKQVPAAFFCTLSNIKKEPALIARMINEGHIVGNHSDTHPRFSEITRTQMANEISACDNYLRENFGYTSPFFRFPEGNYSECALDLVGSLGYKSVFWSVAYADWDVNNPKGRDYAFNTVTARLHPGAVILLHSVSPDNAAALSDIIDWARNNGYEFKALTDLPK